MALLWKESLKDQDEGRRIGDPQRGGDLNFLRRQRNALGFSGRWRTFVFGAKTVDTETDDTPVFIGLGKLRKVNKRLGSAGGV
jgi:hypothetical protein